MRPIRTAVVLTAIALSVAVAAWAQQAKSIGEQIEGKIKQATLQYYLGMVMGDTEQYLKGARLPLQMVKNGRVGQMDEASARTMLKSLAARQAQKPLTKDERTQVIGNMIRSLDEGDIRFIGANTVTIVFLLREDTKTKIAYFCALTLHRADPKAGDWKVIQEVTDSEPVPEEYVK